MNIRITRLSMTNFKCFREKELNLDEDIITIRGRNGAGKTTIADAILFCLFGKNSEGQSDLELFKTRADGKVVHNLDCSVELTLSISASIAEGAPSLPDKTVSRDITLKRSIKEVWVKKRGSEESVFKNNTVEYFVNGESQTKADYEKYISTIVDERVFRAITNPNYFPSLKWQDQRNFLTAMVGDVEVPADNVEFADLLKQLEGPNEDLESYLKHLKYQIKQIKDKLDKIPVRLEEQNKALPENLDWDALNAELIKAQSELKEIDEKISSINQGNGADVRRKELRNQISEITVALDKLRHDAYTQQASAVAEKSSAVTQASLKFNEALNNQKLMEQNIEADKRMIARSEEAVREFTAEIEKLRSEWPTRKFEWNEGMSVCPTCGQYFPHELLQEKKQQALENFNKELETEKQALRLKAARIKQHIEDGEKEVQTSKDNLATHEESLVKIKEDINTIFSEKAELEKEHIPTADEILAANTQYVYLSKQLEEVKEALNSVTDSEDGIKELQDLQSLRLTLSSSINGLLKQLATRQQYDKILALIDGINEEQKDLVKQLSELEKKEDVARQYQFKQNQLLEERINQHFKLVQWKLFRTVNNSGDSFEEPFCECYVDGVGYHSGLNQAARLNAGLDICEALCRFYKVSALIVIDNAESNLNIYQTTGQQIRLQVFDSELNLV